MPSMSTSGSATNAKMKTVVAVSKVGIMSTTEPEELPRQ
jgi:hypothetical protein